MKGEYTEKVHARRLLMMLEKENPCGRCPCNEDPFPYCLVCTAFIGLDIVSLDGQRKCPCHRLGAEAIKRTWLALEAKGYLD